MSDTRNTNDGKAWLAPLTGLAFVVLVIAGFALSGEPPDPTDEPAQAIVDFYVDNEGSQMLGAILVGIAATLFVFFGGVLRRVLRAAEGAGGTLSAVAFAGTIIFAMGLALDSTITFALAESAGEIDPSAVQALAALWQNDFVPLAVGLQTFLLATGMSIVRHRALPAWLGWIAIVVALLAVTPVGFFAFIVSGVLIAIMSVMMAMRARAVERPHVPAEPAV